MIVKRWQNGIDLVTSPGFNQQPQEGDQQILVPGAINAFNFEELGEAVVITSSDTDPVPFEGEEDLSMNLAVAASRPSQNAGVLDRHHVRMESLSERLAMLSIPRPNEARHAKDDPGKTMLTHNQTLHAKV